MIPRFQHIDIPIPSGQMNCPFSYKPSDAMLYILYKVYDEIEKRDDWRDEVNGGKMFGVLIAKDEDGNVGYLKAYSGQINGRADWEQWVPAVFDYLQPDGYFVQHENEISALNAQLADMQQSLEYRMKMARLANAEQDGRKSVDDYRAFMAEQKQLRNARRQEGTDESVLIAESQFQKAELKRLKKRIEAELKPLRDEVEEWKREIVRLQNLRRQMSDDLQKWLFDQFVMLNAEGNSLTLSEIFAPTPQRVPPSGAGECCAPKLLQYAYQHGLKPLEIAEFWWGESPKGEVRHHKECYPACQGKCKPILDFMLQGLDVAPNPFETNGEGTADAEELRVIYKDDYVLVVDKPAGMLSVPGKVGTVSALDVVRRMVGEDKEVFPVHRLDMQTSGVLAFAFGVDCYIVLQREFANHSTQKTYIAVVEHFGEGDSTPLVAGERRVISIPLSADYMNRPCQKVDYENGKEAVTEVEVLEVCDGKARLRLHPRQGRTHQLRVHCAHKDGLNMPIVGDRLYGRDSERLLLHAEHLVLRNPLSRRTYNLHSPCPF